MKNNITYLLIGIIIGCALTYVKVHSDREKNISVIKNLYIEKKELITRDSIRNANELIRDLEIKKLVATNKKYHTIEFDIKPIPLNILTNSDADSLADKLIRESGH